MTAFSLAGLLIALSALVFGIFVFYSSQERRIAKLWLQFSIAACLWGFGLTWIGFATTMESGLLAWRLSYIFGVIWISPIFYHFVCAFLNLKRNKSILANYIVATVFVLFVPTHSFFKQVEYLFDEFYYARGGWLYFVFFTWWMGLVAWSHWEMILSIKNSSTGRKNQVFYFFLATFIGYTGGLHSFLPKMGIDVYPWGLFTVVLYPIIMTYAILKFNLMDIRILIRRTVLLAGIYFILLAIIIPLIFLIHSKASLNSSLQPYFILEILLAGFALSVGPFLYAFFVKRNNYFHENNMAGLTHELKSPLSAIESAISFLSDLKQSKNISEKEAAYLEMIDRNSTRLREYVNDLLISFGSDDKKKLLTFKNENISALFQTIIEKYSPMAQTKNITIHLSGDSNLECCCDSEKITQVLSNLISNAIKFSEGGMINMSFFQEKGQIHCSVADTGKGIKNEDLPFIFERFYQGDAGRQNKGSGIGLTIAKAWVEAHGGKIWAESPANTMTGEAANNKAGRDGESLPAGRCGRGTTVRFTLPL